MRSVTMTNELAEKVFGEDAVILIKEFQQRCPRSGVVAQKLNADWPKEGCIRLTKGSESVEIYVRRPNEMGRWTDRDGVCGARNT